MPPDTAFLSACAQNGLIIDTNVLVVLLIGLYNPVLISKCPKTSDYNSDDFVYIRRLIADTKANIIVTPHILTEVSNLTFRGILYEPGFSQYINHVVEIIGLAEEEHTSKSILLGSPKLLAAFGFADLSIIEAAKKLKAAVLTNEGALYDALCKANCPVINIDHVRAAALI